MAFNWSFKKKSKIPVDKSVLLATIFDKHLQIATDEGEFVSEDLAIEIVDLFRPADINKFEPVDISPLIDYLKANDTNQEAFVSYLGGLTYHKDIDQILSDTGIIDDSSFVSEVRKRVVERFLPLQPSKKSLQFLLNQVFYQDTDNIWLETIPKEQIEEVYDLCGFKSIYAENESHFVLSEITYGIEVLVNRITGKAMETDVNKMVPELQNFDSPFISIQREIAFLNEHILTSKEHYVTSDNLMYKQVLLLHQQCVNYIETAFRNSHLYGISLKVNQALLRSRQQLERISELLPFLVLDDTSKGDEKSRDFFFLLLKYNANKNNVRSLIGDSTQLLSYEITQHSAQTGENYITRTRGEYFKMLRTAAGGGFIVAFLCVFKILLSKIDASDLGEAFFYGMNYAVGFITIYLLGFTLATKQPAMTASALVSAMEQGVKNVNGTADKYQSFAVFFARVFRSQFIAFFGNVMMAFPVALFLIWGLDQLINYNIADKKWFTLVNDLSPVGSPAIFHAAIAGCFLFISGIIAGWIANRDKHSSVYYRIQEHPILKKTFGKEKTMKIAKFYEKRWAGIVSNFWFGIFMGSVGSVGAFIGLDLDIRHITFASGNLALGLYGADFKVATDMIVWGCIGIVVIGLVNFLVSFTLSLILAFRSRDVPIIELRLVAISIWKHFKKHPFHFFFPPKRG